MDAGITRTSLRADTSLKLGSARKATFDRQNRDQRDHAQDGLVLLIILQWRAPG